MYRLGLRQGSAEKKDREEGRDFRVKARVCREEGSRRRKRERRRLQMGG